ncbi:MAG: class II glutamine amidotransferase [Sulfitobacter sp.]
MCRWAAWQGAPILMRQIVSDPGHSLIHQSREASKCKTTINADGFGLAWYDKNPVPGLYRDVYPAWSDPNLRSLCEQVSSRLFMAHVRASTGTATSRNNCHPFVQGRWSFMHNGQIGGFERIRRQVETLISDELYPCRLGATDSEALFLTACGYGLERNPKAAMEQAVARLEALSVQTGVAPHMRLTAALADGTRLYAIRYASDALAPSLFYRWDAQNQGWAVASEPYESINGDWIEVPKGSFCCFEGENCTIEPFQPSILQIVA